MDDRSRRDSIRGQFHVMTNDSQDMQVQDISEQTVADYLAAHVDFFEQHSALLQALTLPHAAGGAISLVERQIALLRDQSDSQKQQLEELIVVARENDRLNGQLHQLTLLLMECQGLEGLLPLLVSRLRRDYAADVAVLHLLAAPKNTVLEGRDEFVTDRAALREPFQQMLASGKPFCGRLKEPQRSLLFAKSADKVASAVVLPLGKEGRIGLLAIGSSDANRFGPGGDTSFLQRMAQVISAALVGHLKLDTD